MVITPNFKFLISPTTSLFLLKIRESVCALIEEIVANNEVKVNIFFIPHHFC